MEQVSFSDLAESVYGEKSEEYKSFLDKFKPKHTTDDCYTPPNIYDAVCEWVEQEYGVDRANFVRPFYPGGDYERYKYPENCIVVDNPPFSILSKIVRFYNDKNIRFFLFAPGLVTLSSAKVQCCAICVGADIVYENGADINTSFVTNLEACAIRSAPRLYAAIKEQNDINNRKVHASLPKYSYPDNVLTAAMCEKYSKYGIDFKCGKDQVAFVRALDVQRIHKKVIYGSGYLISEKAAAEKAAAEKAAAEKAAALRWSLSDREQSIIMNLK